MMQMRTCTLALVGLLAAFGSACSGEHGGQDGGGSSGALKRGSQGPEVQALYDYLTTYGYFENAELRAQYPGWQPIVSTVPSNPAAFDASLEEGLLAYQKLMGLEQTAEVDDATQRMIAMPRCGHPDVDPDRLDPSRKFALYGGSAVWNTTNLSYSFGTPTGDITDEWDQIRQGFEFWSTYSDLTFTERFASNNIAIYFEGFAPASTYAQSFRPDNVNGTFIRFNELVDWRTTNLAYVATHELGHTIGLAHSSVAGAVMFPSYDGTSPVPDQLTTDDRMAVGALYSSWEVQPGAALDISYPTNGATERWAIGTDGYVYRWDANGWTQRPNGPIPAGSARRVAASGATRAAVVTSNNDVYEFVGVLWLQRPGKCVDLAYRSDFNASRTLYCAGTDGGAYRLVNGAWQRLNGVSSVVRIASGPVYNHPEWGGDVIWALLSDGSVRQSRDGVTWTAMPRPKRSNGADGPALDIGVGSDGSVWIVGGDLVGGGAATYIWNEQATFGTAPARNQWLRVRGGASNITVDRWGRPWIVDGIGTISRRR